MKKGELIRFYNLIYDDRLNRKVEWACIKQLEYLNNNLCQINDNEEIPRHLMYRCFIFKDESCIKPFNIDRSTDFRGLWKKYKRDMLIEEVTTYPNSK
jgi:hypothetical protein